MVDAKLDNAPVDLGWAAFGAKMAGALVWLVANAIAAAVMASSQSEHWERAIAAVGLIVPAVVWIGLLFRRLRRSDEFDRNLLAIAVNSGALWVVLFGTLFVVGIAVETALRHGQADLTRAGYLMLLLQPPLAVLYGVSMAQFARWTYARNGRA